MASPETLNKSLTSTMLGFGGGLILSAVYNKSPLSDQGSFIFPTPSMEAFAAVLDIHRASGIYPALDISDEFVVRALMSDR